MNFINGVTGLASKFKRKAFNVNTFSSGQLFDMSGGTMKRTLRGWQLLLLGVGTMVGAGVFVSTGSAAQDKAGPAISLSYLCAGLACTLSALCYAEFSCELPQAGGAFNFLAVTFGEFAGWLTAANLFIEWTVANAAVAKGFSGYFCALTGLSPNIFTVYSNLFVPPDDHQDGFGIEINWLALVFVLILTGLMLLGSAESTIVQNCSVMVYLVIILFIVITGATQVNQDNYTPFAPYGIDGIFKGVTTIFFSYVGFDMVASMAEEAVNPAVDLPVGIIGSLGVATAIYIAMSTVLTGMVSYSELDASAPFAAVFSTKGMEWAAKIVSVGALFGCINSNFGGILGQSRIFVTMARSGLLPKALAKMSSRQVPYWSIIASGGLAGFLAFFLFLDSLWDFVSIGTLFAYGSVCVACLWRRYHVQGETPQSHSIIFSLQILGIIACGFWAGFGNQYHPGVIFMWAVPCGLFALITAGFHFFPQRYAPSAGFSAPLLPWVPACGMMINSFLIGTLSQYSFMFWGIWMAIAIIIYLAYGLHHTQGEGSGAEQKDKEEPTIAVVEGPTMKASGVSVGFTKTSFRKSSLLADKTTSQSAQI